MDFPRNLYITNAKLEGHSQSFVNDTLTYADNLIGKNLPVIFSLKHFAVLLNIDFESIMKIIRHRNYHYAYYLIKKRSGGKRRIIAPYQDIKYIQNWIKVHILDKVQPSNFATAYVKGKSILVNAKTHSDNDIILNIDLKNFFESITEKRVYGIFKSLGYHPNLSVELARLCTVKISQNIFNALPDLEQSYFSELLNLNDAVLVQGAPTSPSLSNLICRRLDKRLSGLSNKNNCSFSRYADDITFSGQINGLPDFRTIKRIVEDEDFEINYKKISKRKKGQRQIVTGLLVNGEVRIPKWYKKEIYRHLHFCKKYGAQSHFDRIAPDKGYRKEWIIGKIMYVNSIEPKEAKKMLKIVNEIEWEI